MLEGEDLPKDQRYLPAKREEEKALFLTKEELTRKLGVDPESRGFTKERVRVDGKKVRGYWVKAPCSS